jgi:hypothetical protein
MTLLKASKKGHRAICKTNTPEMVHFTHYFKAIVRKEYHTLAIAAVSNSVSRMLFVKIPTTTTATRKCKIY